MTKVIVNMGTEVEFPLQLKEGDDVRITWGGKPLSVTRNGLIVWENLKEMRRLRNEQRMESIGRGVVLALCITLVAVIVCLGILSINLFR